MKKGRDGRVAKEADERAPPDLLPIVKRSFVPSKYSGDVHTTILDSIMKARDSGAETLDVVPVVQSSGWGKTRALLQCAVANKAYVIYLNARKNGGGWPSPTPFASLLNVIAQPAANEDYACRFDKFKVFFENQIRSVEI
eukprot:3934438-Rhodomonas_salina.1